MTLLRLSKARLGKPHAAQRAAVKQEHRLAERVGGKRVKGSGAGDEKGDARKRGVMRIEAKCTEKDSFRVTLDMIEKIETAAASGGEIPVLHIEFVDAKGRTRKRVCVVPDYVLEELKG